MTTTLIPRDTLMASLIAKSATAADAEAKPTAAQEAIANADAHLSNAVLPTYTELLAALAKLANGASRPVHTDSCGREHSRVLSVNVDAARTLLARHDKTIAGNFGA